MRANERSEQPSGLLETRLSVTKNTRLVFTHFALKDLLDNSGSPMAISEQIFTMGMIVLDEASAQLSR